MRSRSPILAVLAIALVGAGPTRGQEKEALFLPQDEQAVDELTVRGTSEMPLPAGLSRLRVPNSDRTYYVVDEMRAWRSHLHEAFADIYRNGSDISIGTDRIRSEFIHLRLRGDMLDVRYFQVEPGLLFQISDFFRAGGFANGSGSVEYLEHMFPISSCSGLGAAIERLEVSLRESVSRIGPVPLDTVSVDGLSYGLRVRLGRLMGSFGVDQNNDLMFDVVHSIRMTVRECSMAIEPQFRTRAF